MLWLYVCGNILIMCNALNYLMRKNKEDTKIILPMGENPKKDSE
jgi:uncharacterized BrkB/YihY/UPF0761 family membrane protein